MTIPASHGATVTESDRHLPSLTSPPVSVESLPTDASAAGLRKGVFSGSTECHVRVCADDNASARVCIR
jgi:hypothetical protein